MPAGAALSAALTALPRLVLAALAAAALASSGPARAQEGGRGERGGAPGEFDFYVLALSWSPSYCATSGAGRGQPQCEPGRGLGFVVHGLWPQYERGFPSECGAYPRAPSQPALAEAEGVYPDEGLARHEWRRHGTCSGLDPAAYFRAARRAREAVTIPERFAKPGADDRAAPVEIARLFVAANPGLRPDTMAVTCRRERLEEVRICLTKDLRGFRRCPEVARANCRRDEVVIEAAR